MVKVFITEECGWRFHAWDYPGTLGELRADWAAGRIPEDLGYVAVTPGFRGSIKEIEPIGDYIDARMAETDGMSDDEVFAYFEARQAIDDEMDEEWAKFMAVFGAQMDIHEEDDSFLKIGEEILPWTAHRDADETYKVEA